MDTCDVLIVGGGPAGSACAWKLRAAGIDVVVMDAAAFPRDKVCAGWITPSVADDLALDLDEYAIGRTLQPFTGFRVGIIGRSDSVRVTFQRTVSFGIRRCEFDEYLLRRSGATMRLGEPVARIRRENRRWIVNDSVAARLIVGAAGHFCPVARLLNGPDRRAPLVAAQESEFPIDCSDGDFPTEGDTPELYFTPELDGYGWCIRKGRHMNIGFGRVACHGIPQAAASFVKFLKAERRIPGDAAWRSRGHAYLLGAPGSRRIVSDGALLIGDAAGLAYARSGEGIRPAIESGLIAATVLANAGGDWTPDRLRDYESAVRHRYLGRGWLDRLTAHVPAAPWRRIVVRLFRSPSLVRHFVIERSFLQDAVRPVAS